MIWVGILVGSAMRSVEAVNGVMFATMFPITFLANTFAPTDQMPTVLRFIAEWNPISSLTQAVRVLWGNDQPLGRGRRAPDAPPGPVHDRLDHPDHRGRGAAGASAPSAPAPRTEPRPASTRGGPGALR